MHKRYKILQLYSYRLIVYTILTYTRKNTYIYMLTLNEIFTYNYTTYLYNTQHIHTHTNTYMTYDICIYLKYIYL